MSPSLSSLCIKYKLDINSCLQFHNDNNREKGSVSFVWRPVCCYFGAVKRTGLTMMVTIILVVAALCIKCQKVNIFSCSRCIKQFYKDSQLFSKQSTVWLKDCLKVTVIMIFTHSKYKVF